MKKGRHRRFEEARKLKQTGPSPAALGFEDRAKQPQTEEDEYAAIAERYGVRFDDEEESEEDES